MKHQDIFDIITSHQSITASFVAQKSNVDLIQKCIDLCVVCIQKKGRILFCGNGGSAADAQHLAAELSGRFYLDRKAIDAEALHVNSSHITAVGNDLGFENVFSRALEAKGRPNDVMIAMTTSGTSQNIVNAMDMAKEIGLSTIVLTGAKGTQMALQGDISIVVPSEDTPRIQELHMLIGHIICQQVEAQLFG